MGALLFSIVVFVGLFLSPFIHCGYRTGMGIPGYSWRSAQTCGLLLGGVIVGWAYLTTAHLGAAHAVGSMVGQAIGWALFWALAHWTGYGVGRLVRRRRAA